MYPFLFTIEMYANQQFRGVEIIPSRNIALGLQYEYMSIRLNGETN